MGLEHRDAECVQAEQFNVNTGGPTDGSLVPSFISWFY